MRQVLVLAHKPLEIYPQGHPDQATSLRTIALYLFARFEKLGILSDLDEALAFQRSVLEIRPQGHPDRANFTEQHHALPPFPFPAARNAV